MKEVVSQKASLTDSFITNIVKTFVAFNYSFILIRCPAMKHVYIVHITSWVFHLDVLVWDGVLLATINYELELLA